MLLSFLFRNQQISSGTKGIKKDSFFIRVECIVQLQDNLYSLVEYNGTLST